jgi:hypothetical protein
MSQDTTTKHAYEHTAKMEKAARAEAKEEDALNDAVLNSDNHTGQQGVMATNTDLIEGTEIKQVYSLLPDWHKDELRRLFFAAPGTRLKQGDVYVDIRTPERGELTAHGEEEVHEELLVPKTAVDYEIWNKLLNKPSLA